MVTSAFINMPGTTEMIVIFVVVLIFFGPRNLPKLGRAIGQTMREFKDATNKITHEVMSAADDSEPPKIQAKAPTTPTVARGSAPPAAEPAANVIDNTPKT